MNEMSALQALRAEVPEPSAADLHRAEARFVAAIRAPAIATRAHRPALRLTWRAGLTAGLTAALASVLAVGVMTTRGAEEPPVRRDGAGPGPAVRPEATASAEPRLLPVSVAQVLDLAATAAEADGEIDPRPDQFVVHESITMYSADFADSRYLYRTNRKIWQSADGSKAATLRVEYLEPRAYPGSSLPPHALAEAGKTTMHHLCQGRNAKQDYAYLRTLPTDPDQMLPFLSSGARGKGDPNYLRWKAAGELFRESYLPPAQRAALFRAIKQIAGVELVGQAEDAAGRTGVAVGFVDTARGTRLEMIFDAATFRYLGERAFVVDAKKARAPVGTQVAGTAELSVAVADTAPVAAPQPKDETCTR